MNPRNAPPEYSAEKVSQGRIILRKPWQRWLFGIGVFGGAILTVLITLFAGYSTTQLGERAEPTPTPQSDGR